MRGLLRFLYKYRAFEIFILLQIIGIWLLVQNNRYYGLAYLNSSNAVVGSINQRVFNTEKYFNLREVNNTLSEENAMLREQLSKYVYQSNYQKLPFNELLNQRYNIVPAKVERNSLYQNNNYILLDKGRLQGISPGMGVVGPDGVVGQIKNVSENFSSAISLLHSGISVSCVLASTRTNGTVQWDGDKINRAQLNFVPRHVPVAVGDTVLTSGFNSVFPEGLPVGYIRQVDEQENESFYDIEIELATSFHNLNLTYIIQDKMLEEIDSLNALNPE